MEHFMIRWAPDANITYSFQVQKAMIRSTDIIVVSFLEDPCYDARAPGLPIMKPQPNPTIAVASRVVRAHQPSLDLAMLSTASLNPSLDFTPVPVAFSSS